jgi:monoterpene epsilon-lactone hydrolase
VLLSPATDLVPGGPSMRYNAHADPMFSPGAVDLVEQIYCAGADRSQAALSPLHGDWSRLPPLYFLAGSTEMLLDDAVRAHDRALQAGTDSRIDVWPDLPHVFPLFEMLPEAGRAFAEIVSFIDHHIRRAAVPPLGASAHHEELELLPADVITTEPAGRTAL